MKSNLSYIVFIFLTFLVSSVNAQLTDSGRKRANIPEKKIPTDTISKDSLKIKKPKEVLDAKVIHNAKDYVVQNVKNKTVTLYNEAVVSYNDINLKAGKIIINYANNTVFATGIYEKDSLDETKKIYKQHPVFKQGEQESKQDSITFNFKTKKALVYGVNTKEGEMLVYGEKTKRVNDSTIYIRNIRFTTSHKKNPDYYIRTDKAKLVPGKKIIVGASQMVIADVPTPLYLPFAYFPLEKKRTSGFLIPSWGENSQQGFFLQNGGYYFVVNDYFDLELTGDIYSNGSWAINSNSNYYVRYKYSGNFSFRYQNLINGIRGFNDYSKGINYNIRWSHSQDSKSSPNSRLSASINLGSSKFYRNSMNEIDANQYLNNTMSSSISYYKKFAGTPFNMNVSLNHSQNSNNESIDMTFPSLQVSMDRQYPFAGKGGIKKNAFQKIGVGYSMSGKYQISTNDDEFFTSKMWKGARSGIQHSLNANTNMKVFKYFTLSPNASYRDVWYFDRIEKRYDKNIIVNGKKQGGIVNDTINGFNRFNTYNVGASLSTNIYGTFNFKKGRLKAIRHTIRPSVSWSYQPNMAEKHMKKVQRSNKPNDFQEYNAFTGGIYGSPSSSESNSLNFSLNNTLEAKVSPKEGSNKEEDEKITLLNNLNFSTSYNMVADSLRWSNVSFSAGTSLFKRRLNLNVSGSLNPYQVTDKGVKINKFNPKIFRLENANISANFSISNKDFQKSEDDDEGNLNEDVNNTNDVYGAKIGENSNDFAHQLNGNQRQTNSKKTTKLYHASMPWKIDFVYSIGYRNDGYRTDEVQNHTIGFNGSLEFSPKWKIGFSSGYDFKDKDFAYTRINFSRDLDSFRFNFDWVPFGDRTSYYFFIGIKSSMLSDLKWDKNKPPDKRLY